MFKIRPECKDSTGETKGWQSTTESLVTIRTVKYNRPSCNHRDGKVQRNILYISRKYYYMWED